MKLGQTSISANVISLLTAKLSILLYINELFTAGRRWFRHLLYAIGIYHIVWALLTFFMNIFSCEPVDWGWVGLRAYYGEQPPPGHCRQYAITYGDIAPILSGTGDVMLLIIPMECVWQLRATTRRKIWLSALFALSAVPAVIAFYRAGLWFRNKRLVTQDYTCESKHEISSILITLRLTMIVTGQNSSVWGLAAIEPLVGICCAAIPPAARYLRELWLYTKRVLQDSTSWHRRLWKRSRSRTVSSRPSYYRQDSISEQSVRALAPSTHAERTRQDLELGQVLQMESDTVKHDRGQDGRREQL